MGEHCSCATLPAGTLLIPHNELADEDCQHDLIILAERKNKLCDQLHRLLQLLRLKAWRVAPHLTCLASPFAFFLYLERKNSNSMWLPGVLRSLSLEGRGKKFFFILSCKCKCSCFLFFWGEYESNKWNVVPFSKIQNKAMNEMKLTGDERTPKRVAITQARTVSFSC